MKSHQYDVRVQWTGNLGEGTKTYVGYGREHTIGSEGKAQIPASSDPAFRGDPTRYNPEELLVASLSSCHMLWYLHLCSSEKVIVLEYEDRAVGYMVEHKDGSGEFTKVVLRPKVRIAPGSDASKAADLHHNAHKFCFVARSVKFPVEVVPEIL